MRALTKNKKCNECKLGHEIPRNGLQLNRCICMSLHLAGSSHGMGVLLHFSPLLTFCILTTLANMNTLSSYISHRTGGCNCNWNEMKGTINYSMIQLSLVWHIWSSLCSCLFPLDYIHSMHSPVKPSAHRKYPEVQNTRCTSPRLTQSTINTYPWSVLCFAFHKLLLNARSLFLPSKLLVLRDGNRCLNNQGKPLPTTEEEECPSVMASLLCRRQNFPPWFVWGWESHSRGMGAVRKTSMPSALTAICITSTFISLT